jgi:hypothetical protein
MTQQNPYQPYQQYQQSPQCQPYPLNYGYGQPKKRRWGLFGWVLFIFLAITLVMLLKNTHPAFQKIPLSDFYSELLAGNVAQVTIDGDDLTGEIVDRKTGAKTWFLAQVPTGTSSNWGYTQWLLANANGATVLVNNQSNLLMNILLPLVPWLLIFGFIWFFVFRQLRARSSGQVTMPAVPVGTAPFSAWVYPQQAGPTPAAPINSEATQTGRQ